MPSRNSRGGGESFADALGTGRLVLDGGLATELEARGHDLSGELWSAGLLAAEPAAIVDVHLAYYRAGARVATTASYQASVDGFARAGVDRLEAETLIARSVELAAAARDRAESDVPLFVAASVGPYGATLADGSEYTGDYDLDVAGLRRFHRPRLELLASAGADVLAIETLPCLAEVEAVLIELDRLGGVPAWLSLTCADGRTRRGEDPAEAFAMARDVPSVVAVGLNCTAPDEIDALIPVAAGADRPVLVYPNSGEAWDARRRDWTGVGGFSVGQVRRWVAAGVAAVGGCCRVGPDAIEQIARVIDPGSDRGSGPD